MKVITLMVSALLYAGIGFASEDYIIETHEVPFEEYSLYQKMDADSLVGVGEVIAIGKELVALGESIYTLVQKGKPNITTDFSPINVVPKDATTRQPVDPMDLEGSSDPVRRQYVMTVKNVLGHTLVSFKYKLIFSYGATYDGRGRYVQNAMIIPVDIWVIYGWDVNASMKLLGITNKGTRENPVASAHMAIRFNARSVLTNIDSTDEISVDGLGRISKK
jgi:hypothetical protein